MSDRDAFRANRDAAKAKLHEKRLEAATYTAAEVKVLTEAALRLGRKEAFDGVAEALEAAVARCAPGSEAASVLTQTAENFRNLTSHPSGAVSDERSGGSE